MFSLIGTGGYNYWASLPSNIGHTQMIAVADQLVGLENVYVCTAPVEDKDGGCEKGKRNWIDTRTLIVAENVFVTGDKGSIAAKFPEDVCILIDDRKKYCKAWENAGGIAIQHVPPATTERVELTIKELTKIVNLHQ